MHGAQLTKDHQGGEATPPPSSVLPILQILLLKPEDCNHIVDCGGFTGQWFAVRTRDESQLEVYKPSHDTVHIHATVPT